jgi:hypothetical protein
LRFSLLTQPTSRSVEIRTLRYKINHRDWMMRWYQRLFRRAQTEKQLDAELWFHLEQQITDYVATGI